MLAESPTSERRNVERRYAHGELLLAAFIAARRPLTFDDLACVLVDTGARVSDVSDWLATAQENGLIRDEGYEIGDHGEPVGPRRFTLSMEARAELRARRSERRRRRYAI
jgi:hypothetical protein